MEKEFCTYNQALRLKALGFNEPSPTFYTAKGLLYRSVDFNGYTIDKIYSNECLAPTFSQVFGWFREKYSLIGSIDYSNRLKWYYVLREFITSDIFPNLNTSSKGEFESYEEAELACLEKLLEIVESKSE